MKGVVAGCLGLPKSFLLHHSLLPHHHPHHPDLVDLVVLVASQQVPVHL